MKSLNENESNGTKGFPKEAGGGDVETVQPTPVAPQAPDFRVEWFSLKGFFWFHVCSWFVFVLSFGHAASCLSISLSEFLQHI